MTNFKINFSNPWLLLLLIPAALLTLIPYFRLNKRYRGTRNRITSIVLHLVIMVLCISVLAGITFEYDIPNTDNEVILLVDASFSTEESELDKNQFIQSVIDNSDSMFKLGIVTFGFDQVYAAELTNNTSGLYAKYMQAESPDTSATDIEAALVYASELFKNPGTARIVLVTDAVETDGSADDAIRTIMTKKGIKVDTVYFPGEEVGDEVRLVGMSEPEDKIKVGEQFNVEISIESSFNGYATLVPYDNGVEGNSIQVTLRPGVQTISVPYTFTLPGLHKLSFELDSDVDTLSQNNIYNSYMYLEIFDKILVIESIDNESDTLCDMLREELKVNVISINDEENVPTTLEQLREYDEIILCNISNEDMPKGFDLLLYQYVFEVGGGLFTICGNELDNDPNDENWDANAYTRDDMYGTLYQEMLPVEAINYTPPVAVMILIDSSGSMYDPNSSDVAYEDSKLFYAKQGAEACLAALSERDYVGIMSLAEDYNEHIELTPRPQRDKIMAAIEEIEGGGGTVFSTAIERAGKALSAMSGVEKRHIIIVTDGEPSADDEDRYRYWFKENAKLGITVSIVGIQCTYAAQQNMINILEKDAGLTKDYFHAVTNLEEVPTAMREDLMAPDIKDVNYETFTPKINSTTSITNNITAEDMPTLDGFYGVKAKDGAQVILMGTYTPIYAQWQYGKGMVGTFACDLNGTWSADFVTSTIGETITNNIVNALFPTENIRVKDIDVEVSGNNYKSNLSVFTALGEGETVRVTITSPAAEGQSESLIQTFTASTPQEMSRILFNIKTPGIHEIYAEKLDAEGNTIASVTKYKALSYSLEYNPFADETVAAELAAEIAGASGGMEISDPWQVFENAVKHLHRSVDPRIVFLIVSLTLFLLDIAVRKFKWKWPHEIIRDKKHIKESTNQ